MTARVEITLGPKGIELVLPSGATMGLPAGQESEVLIRILAMKERSERRAQSETSGGMRFYMMHLERHQATADSNCPWCAEEAESDAALVLLHPVTKVPMTAKGLRAPGVSEATAEELF